MPAIGQIVLPYQQPHVQTFINDNTSFTEPAVAPVNPLRALGVFTSKKGRDNVLLNFDSVEAYISEYGEPNYGLYGQPGYMPYAFLSQPTTRVSCMRVMPDDAAYGNVLILAKVKTDETDPLNPKLTIKHKAQFFTGVFTESDFIPAVDAVEDTDPDGDGFVTFPLILINSIGRGVYGNDMRVRISSLGDADKENEYKNYRIEIFTTDNGLERVEMFAGTLYNDAVQGLARNAYAIEDVINGQSSRVHAYVYKTGLAQILDFYKTNVDADTTYTVKDFDALTGINKYIAALEEKISIDTVSEDAISIDRIEGTVLSGGDDGSFSITADPVARAVAIEDMYLSAFRGEVDPKINSKKRVPLEFIFDAAYTDPVKKVLISLISKRYDAFGYIDTGILTNVADTLAWAEFFEDYGDRVFSKQCQHFKIRDPFTGKSIPLTTTFLIASRIATHFATYGNSTPFVGEQSTTLTGAIKNSLLPVIDADDYDTKEALYLKRINYLQSIGEDFAVRGTQTTAQFSNQPTKWSDLSEESNMHVVLQMKRIAEEYVDRSLYNFAEAEDRKIFTENLTSAYSSFTGSKVKSFDVNFQMNEYETERGILHCYLSVVFKTLAKRGIIEIDINKRV